jgi:hypothetical protein
MGTQESLALGAKGITPIEVKKYKLERERPSGKKKGRVEP